MGELDLKSILILDCWLDKTRAIISSSEDGESRQGLLLTFGGAGVTTEGSGVPPSWLCTFRTGAAFDGWTQIEDLMEGLGAGCWRRSAASLKEALWTGWGRARERQNHLSLITLPPPATSPLCLLSSLYPCCHPSSIPVLPNCFCASPSAVPYCKQTFHSLWVVVYSLPSITLGGV